MQFKMARVAVSLSVREAALHCGVSHDTVTRFERGDDVKASTISRMRAAFEFAGVIFVEENGEGPGVRLRKTVARMSEQIIEADATAAAPISGDASPQKGHECLAPWRNVQDLCVTSTVTCDIASKRARRRL